MTGDRTSTMDTDVSTDQFLPLNRAPLVLALILALTMVIAVLVGARMFYDKVARQPVAMSAIDSPDASSLECSTLIDRLPSSLLGHRRTDIAEPAPAGAAAWSSNSTESITLRCGVSLPLQYTTLSHTIDAAGSTWLRVVDATPGANLETWYSVNRHPAVAVTTTRAALGSHANPVDDLGESMSDLSTVAVNPHPAPLATLESAGTEDRCDALLSALPNTLGDFTRLDAASVTASGLPAASAAWTAEGQEPVVLRCGVAPAPGYAPGAQLQQVNDIPWFEDTTLANGTTSSTWFALDREAEVAVSMPQSAGNAVIVGISSAINEHLPRA